MRWILHARTSRVFMILIAMTAFASHAGAQGRLTLSGIVRDESGAAIAGANVFIEGTTLHVTTGTDGAFAFDNLSGTRYQLRIERTGYATSRVAATAGAAPLTITLATRAIEIGGVTIIGSGREAEENRERLRDNPGSVTYIEPQALRATRQANLPDVLRFVPGVFAQPRFGAADETQLSIRGSGLRNNFHLRGVNILVNGMPYRNADGFTDFESLELLTAQSIQVYKAANAFRFGGSTLGGAVDIETKTGYTADLFNVNAETGAYGFFKGQISSGAVSGPFDYYASYARTQLDGFRDWSGQKRDRFNLHAGYALSDVFDARAFYLYADIQEELPGSLTAEEFKSTPGAAVANNVTNKWGRDYKLHHVGAQLRAQISPTQRIEIAPYVQYRDIVHPIFRVIDQISRDFGAEARYENSADIGGRANRLNVGVQYAFGNIDDLNFDNVAGESGTMRKDQRDEAGTLAAYAEDRFNVTSRIGAVAGLRWSSSLRRVEDHFLSDGDQSATRHFDAFTPRAGLLYELPSVKGQVYANVSRTFEPPLLLEINSLAVPGFVDVKAQDAMQYELGTRGVAHGWAWDLALFNIDIDDEILNVNVQPFPNAPFTVPTYRNAERTRHRGIEAGIERQMASGLLTKADGGDRLTARVSYTRSDFRFVRDSLFAGNKLPGAPDHSLDAEIAYRHPSGVTVRPDLHWMSGDWFVNSANTVSNEGWMTVGARAELLLQRFDARVFIEGRNLTNRIYSGAVNVDDAAGRYFQPADRRGIYAGVQWQH